MKQIGAPKLPRVRPQLQNDDLGKNPPASAGDDCNVKTTQAMIEFATRGAEYPTVTEVRTAMGAPLTGGGTSTDQAIKACAKYGVFPIRLDTFAEMEAALEAGEFCSIGWDNQWVNANRPEMSGDRNFLGWHRVGVFGMEQIKSPGPVWVMLGDPTHDGRVRDHKPYPKGPLMVKRAWVEEAMLATGQFICLAVTRRTA